MAPAASANYRSFYEQSIHYFDRAHTATPTGPIGGPAAWRGRDLTPDDYTVVLTDDQVREFEAALDAARSTKKSLGELSADDFPLSSMAAEVASWSDRLANGSGVVVVRGLPVERWGEDGSSIVFWCLGLHIGEPGAQNPADELLGHVIDLEGADLAVSKEHEDLNTRLYRTNAFIAFHCDAADAVGLLCLRAAQQGGASRIASSVAVLDELWRTEPRLAARFFEPFELDLRGDGPSTKHITIVPSRYDGEVVRTFFHSDYFRSAPRHDDVAPLTELDLRALDAFEAIAGSEDFRLDMDFEPGDIQLINNHTVVHSRTGYVDDPDHPRHLLRLWLSFDRS